jgi:hypothetical protein
MPISIGRGQKQRRRRDELAAGCDAAGPLAFQAEGSNNGCNGNTDARNSDQREDRQYLTDHQFCDLVDVNPRTSMRWRKSGAGPPFVRAGPRRVLYRMSDVTKWLQRRTYAQRAAEAVAK